MGLLSKVGSLIGAVSGSPLLAIGGNLLGGVLTNQSNKSIASANNALSVDLANTAHQREVKDLLAAGLNPMLSARSGGSATPPLQSAVMQNPAPAAVSSGLQAQMNKAQIENIEAQNAKIHSDIGVNTAVIGKTIADTATSAAQARNLGQMTEKARVDTTKSRGDFNYMLRSILDNVDAYMKKPPRPSGDYMFHPFK